MARLLARITRNCHVGNLFPVLTFLPVLTLILPAVLYLPDSDLDYDSLPALTYRLPAPCTVINSET
ncbi:hypothetical protein J4Q44_G00233940, partial [Coregonus suidteri]